MMRISLEGYLLTGDSFGYILKIEESVEPQ